MVQNDELTFIDLSNGGSGHPIFDLMSMYLTYRVTPMDPEKRHSSIMLKDFTDDEISKIWDLFIRSYLETEDEDLIARVTGQISGIACTRILLAVPFIPGLLSEQEIQYYKQRALEFYDAGLEKICFYYALGSMKTAMTEIDAHLRTRLRVIIWKQWKVPKKRQWGLQKLGISKDEARRTAYWGDRYQLVALKSCLSRAVSKEVLARAGLVCCLDYYNERHALKLC